MQTLGIINNNNNIYRVQNNNSNLIRKLFAVIYVSGMKTSAVIMIKIISNP